MAGTISSRRGRRRGCHDRVTLLAHFCCHYWLRSVIEFVAGGARQQRTWLLRSRSGKPAEHDAEERVPHGRLRERAAARQQRRHAGLAARRVVPGDETAERVERHVLAEREDEREPARLERHAAP